MNEPADIPDNAEPAAEPSPADPDESERKQPRSTSIKGTSGRG
jgi:hypothetical protein